MSESLDTIVADGDAISESRVSASRRPDRELLARGNIVGRYVVLSKLGAGGMGVVYAAYDPELDRKVALKVLLPSGFGADSSRGRTMLLREAQALARFSTPEIVAVYDVGEHAAGIWIAMEFIDGQTLGEWVSGQPRTWKEILEVMLTAGRGVAAAHAAGLVHRDLKPDNIMVGYDGRVRVMDFGLTRIELPPSDPSGLEAYRRSDGEGLTGPATLQGRLVGTPAYMAPEQWSGAEVTAAADQFSYCVTMWELLYAQRPFAGKTTAELATAVLEGRIRSPPHRGRVPRWLRRACERGLAVEPDRRWSSMRALLSELARGQKRRRSRAVLLAVGATIGVAAAVEGSRRIDVAARIAACEDEGASFDTLWNEPLRVEVRDAMRATGVNYAEATAEKVMPWLDDYAAELRTQTAAACAKVHVERVWDTEMLDRAQWCVEERKLAFEALVHEFRRADAAVIQGAVIAASSFDRLAPCLDAHALASFPSPPPPGDRPRLGEVRRQLAQSRALQVAGKYDMALEGAREARTRADQLGWPSLRAEARHVEASALEGLGSHAEAEEAGIASFMEAVAHRDWLLAAEAAEFLVFNVGHSQGRTGEGRLWLRHAEAVAGLSGDPLRLREATRLFALGVIHSAQGEFQEAKHLHEQAHAIFAATLGAHHPEVANSLNSLAIALDDLGDSERARGMHEEALRIYESALGAEHPTVATSYNNLAEAHVSLKDFETAKRLHERALHIYERAFGDDHPSVAGSLTNLAGVLERLDDAEEARSAHERAIEIYERVFGPEHPRVATSLSSLGVVYATLGEYDRARQVHVRALELRERILGREHVSVAQTLANLAVVHNKLGEYEAARDLLMRALEIREQALGPDHPAIAQTRTDLALVEARAQH